MKNMKKYLLSAALLIAVCISAKAQFSLGIKGGVNYSTVNTDNLKSSGVAGYEIGAFARFRRRPLFTTRALFKQLRRPVQFKR